MTDHSAESRDRAIAEANVLRQENAELREALRLLAYPSMGETRYPGTDRESTHIGWQTGPSASDRIAVARALLAKGTT